MIDERRWAWHRSSSRRSSTSFPIPRRPDLGAALVEQDVDAALTTAERAYVPEIGPVVATGQAGEPLADPGINPAGVAGIG